MADVRPGEPFTPGFLIKSPNGSPETSGVSGTLILDSPTTTAATSGALSHQGGGVWGYTIAGSFTLVSGTYGYRVASLVTPSGTLVDQVGSFEVGYDNAWTVREMYTRIREDLGDGWVGSTTSNGSVGTLVDSKFGYGAVNDWLSSEIFFFEPGAPGDTNPVRVIGFNGGNFTFTPPVTSTVAGQDFIIGNKDGQGWRHEQVLGAITTAVRRCGHALRLTDETSLTYATTTAEYGVPAAFAEVTALAYQPPGALTGEWAPIADRYWDWQPDRRRIVFTRRVGNFNRYVTHGTSPRWSNGFAIPQGSRLRLTGRALLQVPGAMGATIDADPTRVYDLAMMGLLMQSADGGDRQRAAMIAGTMGRPPIKMPGS